MRAKVVFIVFFIAAGILFSIDYARLRSEVKTLRAQSDGMAAAPASEQPPSKLPGDIQRRQTERERGHGERPTSMSFPPGVDRVAVLENQVQSLSRQISNSRSVSTGPSFPEYDPTSPAVPETPITQTPWDKRAWGGEQATGPPDTSTAGDHPTAWASREPDAGSEWLWVDYERSVAIAEVRIRESFNPGAISKVTAVVNGSEVVLWEGTATSGAAPRDFVVRPNIEVSAQSLVVHLDTRRVSGWNEIDAVELIGRDGSRLWASNVNTSSTYAER